MAHSYAWDYRFYYPVFYWSFFLLMLVTDLLFKKYRIEQEREQEAMEAEVRATVEEAQKLMINSVAARGIRDHENAPGVGVKDSRRAFLPAAGGLRRKLPSRAVRRQRLPGGNPSGRSAVYRKNHQRCGRAGCDEFQPLLPEAVLYHRENYDGSGYLEGRSGRQIPVLSRILSVADYADRHARWGETAEEIGKKLEKRKGTRFDPECAEQMRTILCKKEK